MFARLALVGLFALASAGPAPADLIVSLGSPSSVGNTVTVDVFVSGSDPLNPDRLDYFVGEFVVAPVGSAPASGLRFANPPPSSPLFDPAYVFVGNSFNEVTDPTYSGAVTMWANPDDTFTVLDFTSNNQGEDVLPPRLLVRLTLVADGNLLGGPHVYTIGLNPVGSQFQDANFGNLAFTSGSGTITLQGNADAGGGGQAVPEPGPLLGLTMVLPVLAGWLRSRRNAVPK